MFLETLRKLKLLLYKNYLVRKREWTTALIMQIFIPLLGFYILNKIVDSSKNQDVITYPIMHESDMISQLHEKSIYVAPDTKFTQNFMTEVQHCTDVEKIKRFKTEKEMLKACKEDTKNKMFGVVFYDLDDSASQFKYKIHTVEKIPPTPIDVLKQFYPDVTFFSSGMLGLQMCLDKTFLEENDKSLELDISMQWMPIPAVTDYTLNLPYISLIMSMVFYLQLTSETRKSSEEKFLGVNVLMSMNGVPNYLNLLSWLISGLIFSLFYIIPGIFLLKRANEESTPLLHNANLFLFWLILTSHAAHLFAYGMHISAYFKKQEHSSIVISLIYACVAILNFLRINIPYVSHLGLICPHILLYKASEEIAFYQITNNEGIQWYNLFHEDTSIYNTKKSLGMTIIFSLLGTFIHFILANYVTAINPGKYGMKKHPLYFLEFFKKSGDLNNYGDVGEFDVNDNGEIPSESIKKGASTPGIQVRNLKKTYTVGLIRNAKVNALKGVSLDFYQGQITSLLGHNGAGKTTMMSILTGVISPSEGVILINGKNTKDHMDEIMSDMGLCPQENIVFPSLTIYEQFKFFAMLKNKNKPDYVIERNVKKILKQLKLDDKRDTIPKKLSGGQKRRVCLGMALVGDSSILILDEPTSGLDPEIKRDIWDILLKRRGEKTILISTHDMEEADILGDKVAIIHSGKLRSYGSPLFLKKLIGSGNMQVTVSVEPWCNPENVRGYLGSDSEILNEDGNKVVLSVPSSSKLPSSLDKLESNKSSIGVTGMSVSLITLEQVFLKVAKDDNDKADSTEPPINNSEKLEGVKHSLQAAKGLFFKKLLYTYKNPVNLLMMIILILTCLFMVFISFAIMAGVHADLEHAPINFKLNNYGNPKVFYKADVGSKKFGDAYKNVVKQYSGQVIDYSQEKNLTKALLNYGDKYYEDYSGHGIAGIEFKTVDNNLHANVMANYLGASYSAPISMNLLSNSLIKALKGPNYNIDIIGQTLPFKQDFTEIVKEKEELLQVQMYLTPVVLIFYLYMATALFVIQPLSETLTRIKHLQKMTGLSWINYWGSTFIVDFAIFLILIILIIIGLIYIEKILDLDLMNTEEILILEQLLLLFAVNVLPLIYSCTFIESLKSTNTAVNLLQTASMLIVPTEIALKFFSDIINIIKKIRPIQKEVFMLTPNISLYYALLSFFEILSKNSNCRKLSINYEEPELCQFFGGLCCQMNCTEGICKKSLNYFDSTDEEMSLPIARHYLCIQPLIYFALLWILEIKLIPKMISYLPFGKFYCNEFMNEQVRKEKNDLANVINDIKNKSYLALSDDRNLANVESGRQNNPVFFVYELRKQYGIIKAVKAVKDINFGVHSSECFGLLGVNGAGKSTTFRMMTGEEVPNHGSIYLHEKNLSVSSDRSRMGYCPQNDAIIDNLNTYDHLRLFARLRGIPESEVNNQVQEWTRRLNLTACASQPSHTYSGGNKRRLNIAIAMMGIPDIILLDEPTTGVDPAARRSLWGVIKSSQKSTGQAVILTSHSMEECEALCGRLAIMVDGEFVCIGASEELKQRFGVGYDIQVKLSPEAESDEIGQIKRYIISNLECELVDENSTYLMYHISSPTTKWVKMYGVMHDVKAKFSSVEDFSVLSSSLEHLFLSFAKSAKE